jgi:hypothetical protein
MNVFYCLVSMRKFEKIPSYVTNTYIYKQYSCEIYGISLDLKLNLNFPRI